MTIHSCNDFTCLVAIRSVPSSHFCELWTDQLATEADDDLAKSQFLFQLNAGWRTCFYLQMNDKIAKVDFGVSRWENRLIQFHIDQHIPNPFRVTHDDVSCVVYKKKGGKQGSFWEAFYKCCEFQAAYLRIKKLKSTAVFWCKTLSQVAILPELGCSERRPYGSTPVVLPYLVMQYKDRYGKDGRVGKFLQGKVANCSIYHPWRSVKH